MTRTLIDSLVTEKALSIVNNFDSEGSGYAFATIEKQEIKNVCAKVSVVLSDKIDAMCSFLDVSKRAFIEAALIDALAKANNIIQEEKVFEVLEERK